MSWGFFIVPNKPARRGGKPPSPAKKFAALCRAAAAKLIYE
jgi:hypothetical protein